MASRKKPRSTFNIDTEMVKHVAFLVRLGITEQETKEFSRQCTAIIDYFHLLNEVDTSQVPPATEISNTLNVTRDDAVSPSMAREDFLKNVPHRKGAFVQVPLVFGEE
jgi:aspartyl-tRNA(Asn)/glutamyl-tRNA(Gln) amidotransferase subunit C